MGYVRHIATSINCHLIALLVYVFHIAIVDCVHNIAKMVCVRPIKMFGNVNENAT
jgi:hypothetical protein